MTNQQATSFPALLTQFLQYLTATTLPVPDHKAVTHALAVGQKQSPQGVLIPLISILAVPKFTAAVPVLQLSFIELISSLA